MCGADLRLLEQWCDQAIRAVAVLDAFAHGVDAGIERLQRVADHYATLATQAGLAGEVDARPDAGSHDDEVRFELAAVFELHAGCTEVAGDGNRLGRHAELHAASLQRLLQQCCGRAVELAFHQRVENMHDRNVHALLEQAVRCFESQ
jgi:hypothetical protein